MKSIKLAIIGIVCLTLFGYMQGCSDNTTKIEQIPNLEIPEEYVEVGKLHNEGLDYIFEEIKAQAIEYSKNPQLKSNTLITNYDDFLKQKTLQFCKQNEKLNKNIDVCNDVVAKLSLKLKSDAIIYVSEVQTLLDEATEVLRQEFKTGKISQLKARLDVINKKAAETLSETDAALIFCATSTGYHSYQYWTQNYKKWYFALHYPEILEQYTSEELNQLQLQNGQIRTKGWWNDLWDTVENWFNSAVNAAVDWWNDGGRNIVLADFMGAVDGAYTGFQYGGQVWTIAGGAVSYSLFSSAGAAWW
jgi:hypothetical protein